VAATEAIKILIGATHSLRRSVLSYDVWRNQRAEISAALPRGDCQTCGRREFPHLAGEGRPHITLCGRNSVQIHEHSRPIDLVEMGERLAPHGQVRQNSAMLKFQKDPFELTLFPDGRVFQGKA